MAFLLLKHATTAVQHAACLCQQPLSIELDLHRPSSAPNPMCLTSYMNIRLFCSHRVIERMQSLRQAMTAWQQWRLFKRYQATAASAFHRKQLMMRVLHCWRSDWLVRARAKQQLAKQHKYKVYFCAGCCTRSYLP